MSFIRMNLKVPKNISIAVSGGLDSMFGLSFIMNSKRNIRVLHYNHNTSHSNFANQFVETFCFKNKIDFKTERLSEPIPKGRSSEDFWREKRYEFLNKNSDDPIITCHHLDDVLETWIFSSANGSPKIIPSVNKKILRPFLLNKKSTIKKWCLSNSIDYVYDPSNNDDRYKRNFIRNNVVDLFLDINPGIYKVLSKKINNN